MIHNLVEALAAPDQYQVAHVNSWEGRDNLGIRTIVHAHIVLTAKGAIELRRCDLYKQLKAETELTEDQLNIKLNEMTHEELLTEYLMINWGSLIVKKP